MADTDEFDFDVSSDGLSDVELSSIGSESEVNLASIDDDDDEIGLADDESGEQPVLVEETPAPKKKKAAPSTSESGFSKRLAFAMQMGSTARQHVEKAYEGVDPKDAESRKTALAALQGSLEPFVAKLLEKKAISEADALTLAEMAAFFAHTTLISKMNAEQ